MKKIHILLLIACLTIFVSCKKDPKESSQAKTLLDVSYGTDAKQKMDVYIPANHNSNTPVVILIHGGGFVAGNRKDFSPQAQALTAQGFAVLNLSYRLVDTEGVLTTPMVHKPSVIKIEDQLNDIQAAVNLAATKTAEWTISGR